MNLKVTDAELQNGVYGAGPAGEKRAAGQTALLPLPCRTPGLQEEEGRAQEKNTVAINDR